MRKSVDRNVDRNANGDLVFEDGNFFFFYFFFLFCFFFFFRPPLSFGRWLGKSNANGFETVLDMDKNKNKDKKNKTIPVE